MKVSELNEKGLEAARTAWMESASDYTRLSDAIDAAIRAYLAASQPQEGEAHYPLLACGECGNPVRPEDETIIGEVPMHRACADMWADRNADTIAGRAVQSDDEPVAWRVKDYADGWILCRTKNAANDQATNGNLIQPLYAHPPTDTPQAEGEDT